jgi:ATP synthase protein I
VPNSDVAAIRGAAVPTAVVCLVASVVGAVLKGVPGLIGGLLGTLVVLAFFVLGQLVVARVLNTNPQVGTTAALLVFTLQVLALLVLLLVLRDATWLDGKIFAFTVLVGTLTWTVSSVVVFNRMRRPSVVPGSGPGHPDGPAPEEVR